MMRYYSLEVNSDQIPNNDSIHCHGCRAQVATFNDYIRMAQTGVGLFHRVYNVYVPDSVSYHLGITVANTYCGLCGEMIGWKVIAAPRQDIYVRVGRFCMLLHKLSFSNDVQLLGSNEEQNLGANEENADQDGEAHEQVPNQQEVGANNEQVPDEQDVGANERNADQDGGSNEQVPNEQDVGANERNANQYGGGNAINHDQDEGRQTKRRRL